MGEMCEQLVAADRDHRANAESTSLYQHFAVKPNPGDAVIFWHW